MRRKWPSTLSSNARNSARPIASLPRRLKAPSAFFAYLNWSPLETPRLSNLSSASPSNRPACWLASLRAASPPSNPSALVRAAPPRPAQAHVHHPRRAQPRRVELASRIGQMPQHAEISEQLKLQSMMQLAGIEFARARFVVDHHRERFVRARIAPQIDAVNAAAKQQRAAIAQIQAPGRQSAARQPKLNFHRARIEFVLRAHPADEGLDQLLQPLD